MFPKAFLGTVWDVLVSQLLELMADQIHLSGWQKEQALLAP